MDDEDRLWNITVTVVSGWGLEGRREKQVAECDKKNSVHATIDMSTHHFIHIHGECMYKYQICAVYYINYIVIISMLLQ